eukprot:TRINITY_DN5099_c0_g1_i1.p1 TRINITY_DN5099_c0_g1~~TRINITY_DN5099_c0_g1_i1.p1  ORF type:complete len:559 (+),score=177.02 TRINITY_DN5099_c0_g1_i1:81-1679(+)
MPAAAVALFAAASFAAAAPQCSNGKSCPHLLLVVVDDLGWNNVPWHDTRLREQMPRSAELVQQGVELDRHYAYLFCSPSRSSALSGRLPFHVNQANSGSDVVNGGIPREMATIASKLKLGGYSTHMAGKWHCGVATQGHIPHGRGFDTHLGYFAGAEDHFTQLQCIDAECNQPDNKSAMLHDLWDTTKPAHDLVGNYGDDLFTKHILKTIAEHDTATPYFAYWAIQNNHEPLQVPSSYSDKFPKEWVWERRTYAGMAAHWDEQVGQVADKLKARGMWEHTLWVQTADNGGPVYPSATESYPHCGGANNYPLRGGKTTNFEGGVRTAAFATGGLLPAQVRGTRSEGYVHITDWFATFCGLAGVDPADNPEGLPGVDSIDMWPYISGSAQRSPRAEIPLGIEGPGGARSLVHGNWSALIIGDMKVISGLYNNTFWMSPDFPNATECCRPECWLTNPHMDCGTIERPTCLYNITADPTEHTNLAAAMPATVRQMARRMLELRETGYYPDRSERQRTRMLLAAKIKYGGFLGPWLP